MASAIEARSSSCGHVLVLDPFEAVGGDLPVGFLHGGDLLGRAHQGGGDAIDGDGQAVGGEVAPQPPEAGAGAVLVHRLHVGVALVGPGRGADDVGEEGLGRGVAVEDVVLAALFVVEHDLHRDIGAAGPFGIGRRTAVAEHVAGVSHGATGRNLMVLLLNKAKSARKWGAVRKSGPNGKNSAPDPLGL